MTTRFRIIWLNEEQAQKAGVDNLVDYYPDHWDRARYGLFEFTRDGKPLRLVGTDGGEPEDNTLNRDWHWVVDALNAQAAQHDALLYQYEACHKDKERLRQALASHFVAYTLDHNIEYPDADGVPAGIILATSCLGCEDYKDDRSIAGRVEPSDYPHRAPCPLAE